jgi:hypothetical protein
LVLQFMDFSTISFGFSKFQAQHKRKGRIFFHNHPWKVLDFTKLPSFLRTRPSSTKTFTEVPSATGEARRRRCGPGLANKYHRVVIGLTRDLVAMAAWPERSPASGGGGAGAAWPRRREVRRRESLGCAMCCTGSFPVT